MQQEIQVRNVLETSNSLLCHPWESVLLPFNRIIDGRFLVDLLDWCDLSVRFRLYISVCGLGRQSFIFMAGWCDVGAFLFCCFVLLLIRHAGNLSLHQWAVLEVQNVSVGRGHKICVHYASKMWSVSWSSFEMGGSRAFCEEPCQHSEDFALHIATIRASVKDSPLWSFFRVHVKY